MKRIFRWMRRIIVLLLSAAFMAFIVFGAFYVFKGYVMYRNAVEDAPITQSVEEIRAVEHYVKYDELSAVYIDAVISAEDKRFETHCGIDPLAVGRAVWTDIKTLSFAEGGSTITQQLAKNMLFTQEKRMERKFAEIFAALALEKAYSKKELFELYVNTIYFGSGYYGIYDAAQGYFGKQPSELTDYEAVMLAGIPNAPSAYALNSHEELARQRMKMVLERMIECGRITKEKAERLQKEADEKKYNFGAA